MIFSLILITVLLLYLGSLYFLKDLSSRFPEKNEFRAARAIIECVQVCSKFLTGRLVIVVIVIILYFLGFWIGQVPYPFFIALIAGLFFIVPVFGTILGGIIAYALAFVSAGFTSLPIVLGVIIVTLIIADYVLTPWILGGAVKLNSFMTIVSVIGFTFLWGPVGAIFALPIISMLRVLLYNIEGANTYGKFLMGEK